MEHMGREQRSEISSQLKQKIRKLEDEIGDQFLTETEDQKIS